MYLGLIPNFMIGCNNLSCDGSYYNKCDVCVGGNTGLDNDTSIDCNGDCFGKAIIDNCGNCTGGNTGIFFFMLYILYLFLGLLPDYLLGCNNNSCDGSYTNICGYCVGGNTGLEPDYMIGCNNSCDGSYLNKCNICVGGETGLDNNTGIDCFGECSDFTDCDNFTLNFNNNSNTVNSNGEIIDLNNVELNDGNDLDIYINSTNELSKNITFHMALKKYDYYPDFDMYYYSYSSKTWKTIDREVETFKPNDIIQIYLHFYIEIMYKEKRRYRSIGFNSLVLYFSVEGRGPIVEQYVNYTMKYTHCGDVNDFYRCSNMPGCFFCTNSVGYNVPSVRDKLDVDGFCIEGNLTSQCFDVKENDYSNNFTFSYLLLFIISIIYM